MKEFFSTIWKYWKKFGEFMGNLIGRIFLTLFYITITLPFGLIGRFFTDPMDIKKKDTPTWVKREPVATTIEGSYDQF